MERKVVSESKMATVAFELGMLVASGKTSPSPNTLTTIGHQHPPLNRRRRCSIGSAGSFGTNTNSNFDDDYLLALARSVLEDDDDWSSCSSCSSHSSEVSSIGEYQECNDTEELQEDALHFSGNFHEDDSTWLSSICTRTVTKGQRRVYFATVTVYEYCDYNDLNTDDAADAPTDASAVTTSLVCFEREQREIKEKRGPSITCLRKLLREQESATRRAIAMKEEQSRKPPPIPIRTRDDDSVPQRKTSPQAA